MRKNQPAPRPLPDVPTFDAGVAASLDAFKTALSRMGGRFVRPPPTIGDLDAQVRDFFPMRRSICSAMPEVEGQRPDRPSARTPQTLHDVDVGVVRAVFGVAETGSIWLSDARVQSQRAGFPVATSDRLARSAGDRRATCTTPISSRDCSRADYVGVHDGTVGDRRYRRRTDPWCPGHTHDVGHSVPAWRPRDPSPHRCVDNEPHPERPDAGL